MSCTTDDPRPAGHEPFARLIRELTDLDYSAGDPGEPGTLTYTYRDGRLAATIDRAEDPNRATLAVLDRDGAAAWELTLTDTTPDHVQILALYTALHADAGGIGAVLRSVTEALSANLDATTAAAGG